MTNTTETALRDALQEIYDLPGELNMANYDENDVRELNDNFTKAILIAEAALSQLPASSTAEEVREVIGVEIWDGPADGPHEQRLRDQRGFSSPSSGEPASVAVEAGSGEVTDEYDPF